MDIFVNENLHTLSENRAITDLLNELELEGGGFAIAVNESVIPRSQWSEHQLSSQDKVILIRATAGG